MALSKAGDEGEEGGLVRAPRRCVRACVCIRDVMRCATRRRCARIVNVMLMVLMGSRCHTSGMRIQSHAGVTLLPVYMPRVRTLQSDHLQSLTSVNHQPLAPIHFRRPFFLSFFFSPSDRSFPSFTRDDRIYGPSYRGS